MACEKCNDRGWILVCANCGSEASLSFNGEDLYEWCKECERKGIVENNIVQEPCILCSKTKVKSNITFKEVIESTLSEYSKDYGEIKFYRIRDKVLKSKYVMQSLINFKNANIPPSINGINSILCSSMYFGFGPKKNLAIGGTIFLYLWNEKCNMNNRILSDTELIKLLEEFLKKTAGML
jgi:hypothetical protein